MRTWTLDDALCRLTWSGAAVPVRVRAEVADEPHRAHTPQREFVPLTVASGIRTRVIAQPYIQEPGEAVRSIGAAEAYFYHEDAVLLLWRCRLLEQFRAADPATDDNLHARDGLPGCPARPAGPRHGEVPGGSHSDRQQPTMHLATLREIEGRLDR
jgi:hypothetical protein